MKLEDMSCVDCAAKSCRSPGTEYPAFCLTTHMDQKVLDDAMACYQEEENHRIAVAAAEVEHEFYCRHTRVEEIMDFARKIGAQKIGIATCIGLLRESRILAEIFRKKGFTVYGVSCKAGSSPRSASAFRRPAAPPAPTCATPSSRPSCSTRPRQT